MLGGVILPVGYPTDWTPRGDAEGLARAYAEADAAERVALVARGDGMPATWNGTAFDVDYFFNLVTLLMYALLMYRSLHPGYGALRPGRGRLIAVPSNFGTVGLVYALASLVPWAVFAVLVARRLPRLAAAARLSLV